ncbi:MAG: VPLPA-CTERM sorting domain-containing protein [Gammaproteobacteria bacterium]|nr:MAG: VPLPA-CTERM sorting domain-containing protein [Gammaproteobacteria bacterium]
MSNPQGKGFALLAAAAMVGFWAAAAGADVVYVTCPNTVATTDREFAIGTDPGTASCIVYGNGNSLNGGGADSVNALGYVTLDSTADGTTGLLNGSLGFTDGGSWQSGTFSIAAPGYTSFVIGLQASTAGINPDYAAFLLPDGETLGSWSISSTDPDLGSVNRAILYGIPVPLPAASWLLLSGIAGLGFAARRRGSLRAGAAVA